MVDDPQVGLGPADPLVRRIEYARSAAGFRMLAEVAPVENADAEALSDQNSILILGALAVPCFR